MQPTQMMTRLRQFLVAAAQQGAQASTDQQMRRLIVGAAKLARSPRRLLDAIDGINATEAAQIAEARTWLTSEQIAKGEAGRFDSADIRNWLAIAERAGVAAIPAREITRFTPEEYSALSGTYGLDRNNPRVRRAFDAIAIALNAEAHGSDSAASPAAPVVHDLETLSERLFTAMDDVPEGWMVRASVCGGDNLKALAGCGVTETFIPEVRFGNDLEIGPGWVRTGNRRRIDIQDKRTMDLYIRNDTVDLVFLARPWVIASRWLEGRDPHRAGTPLDISGTWPAEWRAFVRDGRVVGVSAYYAWAGTIDPHAARMALLVREKAQAIANEAIRAHQTPRSMDDVLARRNDFIAAAMAHAGFADGAFDCTLDFIEAGTAEAPELLLLEGGPGCGMLGGGHPCGFAGDLVETEFEGQPVRWHPCEGVAFRTMDHILMGEPATWSPGDKANAILSWDDAEALAVTPSHEAR